MNNNFKFHTSIFISVIVLFVFYIAFTNFKTDKAPANNSNTKSSHTNINISSLSEDSNSDNINNNNKVNEHNSYISTVASSSKKNFSLNEYLSNLNSTSHTIKQGETLSNIARLYEQYCNHNSCVKLISLVNNLSSPDNLEIGDNLLIPEKAIKTGTLYTVSSNDTWYKIALQYYPAYTTDSITNFIITVNNLPNNDLPLGEKIFLPQVVN